MITQILSMLKKGSALFNRRCAGLFVSSSAASNRAVRVTALAFILCAAVACKKEAKDITDTEQPWYNDVQQLSWKELNSTALYKDGDSWEQVKNLTFRVNKPIRVTTYDKDHFQVNNFVPMDIANVYVTLKTSDADIVLVKIDTLKAHTRNIIAYPFDAKSRFYDTDGKPYTLADDSFDLASAEGVNFDIYGIDNPVIDKIKRIRCQWNVTFKGVLDGSTTETTADDNNSSGNYTSRPVQMRLITSLLLNSAYVMSMPEFVEELYTHQMYLCKDGDPVFPDRLSYTGQGWTWFTDASYGNATTTYASNKEAVDAVLSRLYSARYQLNMGMTSGGGLASVSNYGGMLLIDHGNALSTYKGKDPGDTPYRYNDPLLKKLVGYLPNELYSGPMPLFAHELGHTLGFGHNSNFCSTGQMTVAGLKANAYYGFPAAANCIFSREAVRHKLLINQDEYYRPQDYKSSVNSGAAYTQLPVYSGN